MSFGIAAGGFAQGRHRALSRQFQGRQLDIMERQLNEKERQNKIATYQDAIDKNTAYIREVVLKDLQDRTLLPPDNSRHLSVEEAQRIYSEEVRRKNSVNKIVAKQIAGLSGNPAAAQSGQIPESASFQTFEGQLAQEEQRLEMQEGIKQAHRSFSLINMWNPKTEKTAVFDAARDSSSRLDELRNNGFIVDKRSVQAQTPEEAGLRPSLTASQQGQELQSLASLRTSLERTKEIGETFSKEFLTFGGKFKLSLSKIVDKTDSATLKVINSMFTGLSPEEQELFIGRARVFKEQVEQEFNQYRKEITGAAASVQELALLREALINTDLSPAEFRASLNRYQRELERGIRIKQELVANKIGVGDSRYAAEFDKRFRAGRTGGLGPQGGQPLSPGTEFQSGRFTVTVEE